MALLSETGTPAHRKLPGGPVAVMGKLSRGVRPDLPGHGVPPQALDLIQRGWSNNPKMRPSFRDIIRTLEGEVNA